MFKFVPQPDGTYATEKLDEAGQEKLRQTIDLYQRLSGFKGDTRGLVFGHVDSLDALVQAMVIDPCIYIRYAEEYCWIEKELYNPPRKVVWFVEPSIVVQGVELKFLYATEIDGLERYQLALFIQKRHPGHPGSPTVNAAIRQANPNVVNAWIRQVMQLGRL